MTKHFLSAAQIGARTAISSGTIVKPFEEREKSIKTVVEIDLDFLVRLESNIEAIRQSMENMGLVKPQAYLSPNEFCAQIKSSRWKVNLLLKSGVLKYKKIGRKIYIPFDEVNRFFSGQLNHTTNVQEKTT